jgi:hypothetical protein
MGALTRRSLIGSALAGGGALLAPGITRVLAAEPGGEVFEMALPHGRALRAPRPFDMVAIAWDSPADARIRLRARRPDGMWGPWLAAHADHGHGPDAAGSDRRRGISEPVWTDRADAL